jgi:hypothetical protein
MMSKTQRIEALVSLGYTDREAEFLCLAALHSGFFLRRHYLDFLGCQSGYADDILIGKVTRLGHGRVMTLRQTQLCHLSSRPFYAAIGEPDNRHRRMRSALSMRTKLMALDYVLANRLNRYLATEEEKVDYFYRELGVAAGSLPVKTYHAKKRDSTTERYFVDKFPIAIIGESSSAPAVVSFCYIDEGSVATPGFETWLNQYSGLFSALAHFRVVYVSTKDADFAGAKRLFRHFSRALSGPRQSLNRSLNDRLLRYFQLEDSVRSGDTPSLTADSLDELARLKLQFKELNDARTAHMFELWKQGGTDAVNRFLDRSPTPRPPREALFATFLLPHCYSFLFQERSEVNA